MDFAFEEGKVLFWDVLVVFGWVWRWAYIPAAAEGTHGDGRWEMSFGVV